MSTEQKTKETVCTSDDAMVVVTTKVEVNKDQCCGGGNQTGDFVTQEEFRKYQKFVRLHGGKDIYYNYQLSDGVTPADFGNIDDYNFRGGKIKVYNNDNIEVSTYYVETGRSIHDRISNIEEFFGKNIKFTLSYYDSSIESDKSK
ncbi:hypothetical protein HX045_10165 [Myroides odoratimimus]|uniref:Uncharacterized protein n=1 Tax=Myroides odoratimimus CIP 101113 TaxID=883154 RepID=A0AAV3EZZ1_9FLAO|nr:hypothetical protein [Myroides odoratimimus]EHO05907.1 hypothetical protein HMPREF9715_03181 [Myroides odoratimimus CIP 101113]MCA4792839.1 hypothetical protein [Myroides odoratimimus]MCA4806010.1 hypothetical protein [Myroides odoratimimus]MCA4820001.1 hypothetical protein [Myroides odoratimimus]MCO7722000.1 hypothetical protein [Myroides odoratimimus]